MVARFVPLRNGSASYIREGHYKTFGLVNSISAVKLIVLEHR